MDSVATHRTSDLSPLAERILRFAARSHRLRTYLARVPPPFRSGLSVRISAALQRRRPAGEALPLPTNLGISSRLRVNLSADADPLYLFGKPALHVNERGALGLCSWLAPRSDVFIDIGSHRGLFVFLVACRSPGGRILFFEPDPALFREISQNVSSNGLQGVSGYSAAVGAASGPSTFYLNLTDPTSSSLTTRFAHAHEIVPVPIEVITFRDVVRREGIRRALVKVDIEGAEDDFLQGAIGATEAISYLVMEVLGPAVQAGFVLRAARELAMHAYYVDGLSLRHSPDGTFAYTTDQLNWLFAREGPEALEAVLAGSDFSVRGR